MSGILLRLAAPMQSWGIAAAFNNRDTHRYPTRSALFGLIASAYGNTRTTEPDKEWEQVRLAVRIDRAGTPMTDYHTIGGGRARELTVPTADGGRRPLPQATVVSHRDYLADAAFTAALDGPENTITGIARALVAPHWAPYLGRRSCPPEAPLLLTPTPIASAAAELDRVPLARTRPRNAQDTVPVEFVWETPSEGDGLWRSEELPDQPQSFHPHRRAYHDRQVYLQTRALPAGLCAGYGIDYLTALHAYLEPATS
ncbi:CRISPR system Cascade subunit CasD [Crossiella equi]|uniref:CRISPR system Cascade subunit CasD n=1 Tax=Crossiella equi TaxID=130796 RepID=A0ABS5AM23_9PSEU|nr:type I-E CRISPR-associated protein Cas5/CasD [Crossiella equi]MBP2477615.1 CRISPR system Cascade subunit CasD [Crossiella equi]